MSELNRDGHKLDTLLINGKFYTLRSEGETVEAVGIRDGRIAFTGSAEEASGYTAEETIDLRGKTIIPGLGDSHLHLYAYCQNRQTAALDDVRSIEELIGVMKEAAENSAKGIWLKGTGFDQTKFSEGRMPTRQDLDRISTEHPIVIRRCCLHAMVANSLAIEKAGIGQCELQEYAGLIECDHDNNLNGVFREKATALFDHIIPDPLSDPELKKQVILDTLKDMASKGITAAHTYAAKIWNYEEEIETYRELEREGGLPLRIVVSLDEVFEPEKMEEEKSPSTKVKFGSYKIFTDGSLGARSAALTEDYADDPGNKGISLDKDKLVEALQTARRIGLQPAIHAIGDRALDITLDAIESVFMNGIETEAENSAEIEIENRTGIEPAFGPSSCLPIRIIHAQVVRPDQIKRLKRLPVVLDIQPVFLCTDLYWIEQRLGKRRMKNAYLWKTMTENGLIMTGGSDCPVESYDPIRGIHAAVMRQDLNGFPPEGWRSCERLSVYDAVCLFSKNIAYATGDQDVLGTIEAGKFADLTILDEDPFQINPEHLKNIRIAMTFVDGNKVYDASTPDL